MPEYLLLYAKQAQNDSTDGTGLNPVQTLALRRNYWEVTIYIAFYPDSFQARIAIDL